MIDDQYRREQELISIKYGIKKYVDEMVAAEMEAAKGVKVPNESGCDRSIKRKVISRRKFRRMAVLVSVLLASLLIVSTAAGAFGNLWKWLSVQISNNSLTFQDPAGYAQVFTADGTPAGEVYASLAAQCPEVDLVVPGWLPEGTVLTDTHYDQITSAIDMEFTFEEGIISIIEHKTNDNLVGGEYPLERNSHDLKTIQIMGQQASYAVITNELGQQTYAASWHDASDSTYYNLSVTTSDSKIFFQTVDKLKEYQ